MRIVTERLELIAGTPQLLRAEKEGTLSRSLGVAQPASWPPPLNDAESLTLALEKLSAGPQHAGWWSWYVLLEGGGPLVGLVGFKGPPSEGTVELGYSTLPEAQRSGYATEASKALLGWAFSHPGVERAVAHVPPDLAASIRVLQKLGFEPAASNGDQQGAACYTVSRSAFERASRSERQ